MEPGRQLLSAQIQIAKAGYQLGPYRWDIHHGDMAVLHAGLGVEGYFLGIPLRVTDDPALIGEGPVLVRVSSR